MINVPAPTTRSITFRSRGVTSATRVALMLGLALCVFAPTSAQAAPSEPGVACWKLLLNDYYDEAIAKVYDLSCYDDAISHLPPSDQFYSSAKEDLIVARAAAAQGKLPTGTQGTTTTTTTTSKKKTSWIDKLNPGGPDAFPLPLLVLGAIAILLVIAGGVGMFWQRKNPGSGSSS